MHACLRHGNDWATTTNIINKNKVTRDAAVYDGQNSRLLESDRVRVTGETQAITSSSDVMSSFRRLQPTTASQICVSSRYI